MVRSYFASIYCSFCRGKRNTYYVNTGGLLGNLTALVSNSWLDSIERCFFFQMNIKFDLNTSVYEYPSEESFEELNCPASPVKAIGKWRSSLVCVTLYCNCEDFFFFFSLNNSNVCLLIIHFIFVNFTELGYGLSPSRYCDSTLLTHYLYFIQLFLYLRVSYLSVII